MTSLFHTTPGYIPPPEDYDFSQPGRSFQAWQQDLLNKGAHPHPLTLNGSEILWAHSPLKEAHPSLQQQNHLPSSKSSWIEKVPISSSLAALFATNSFFNSDGKPTLWQYLVGTNQVIIAAEEKLLAGMVPPNVTNAKRVRVGFGGLSLGVERVNTGVQRLDFQLGRNVAAGVAITRGPQTTIAPYYKWAGLDFRVKHYPDHVSLKFSDPGRAANGLGKTFELRLSKNDFDQFSRLLKTKGETQAAKFLNEKHGIHPSKLGRFEGLKSGIRAFAGDMALFWGVGKLIDGAAEVFGFDPLFQGRVPAQILGTIAISQGVRAARYKARHGQPPQNWGSQAICSIGEGMAGMAAYDVAGLALDNFSDSMGWNRDFFLRPFAQFALMWGAIFSGKKLLGFECWVPPEENTTLKIETAPHQETPPLTAKAPVSLQPLEESLSSIRSPLTTLSETTSLSSQSLLLRRTQSSPLLRRVPTRASFLLKNPVSLGLR